MLVWKIECVWCMAGCQAVRSFFLCSRCFKYSWLLRQNFLLINEYWEPELQVRDLSPWTAHQMWECPSFYKTEYNFSTCLHHSLFIHASVGRPLDCFHLLATVNNAAMNVGVQISVGIFSLKYFECIPWRGISASYSNSIFNFLRSHHTCIFLCFRNLCFNF